MAIAKQLDGNVQDPQLASWVTTQRQSCDEKLCIDHLKDIGIEWNPYRDDWTKVYQRGPPTWSMDKQTTRALQRKVSR